MISIRLRCLYHRCRIKRLPRDFRPECMDVSLCLSTFPEPVCVISAVCDHPFGFGQAAQYGAARYRRCLARRHEELQRTALAVRAGVQAGVQANRPPENTSNGARSDAGACCRRSFCARSRAMRFQGLAQVCSNAWRSPAHIVPFSALVKSIQLASGLFLRRGGMLEASRSMPPRGYEQPPMDLRWRFRPSKG